MAGGGLGSVEGPAGGNERAPVDSCQAAGVSLPAGMHNPWAGLNTEHSVSVQSANVQRPCLTWAGAPRAPPTEHERGRGQLGRQGARKRTPPASKGGSQSAEARSRGELHTTILTAASEHTSGRVPPMLRHPQRAKHGRATPWLRQPGLSRRALPPAPLSRSRG